jgi:hypothetical protein
MTLAATWVAVEATSLSLGGFNMASFPRFSVYILLRGEFDLHHPDTVRSYLTGLQYVAE